MSLRLADFPDVPTARELALNDEMRELIRLTEAPFAMAWPYAAPPGLPPDRAQALQDAFAGTHRDRQFLAEAKAAGVDVSPVSASELRQSIDDLSRTPTERLDYVRKPLAMGKGGG